MDSLPNSPTYFSEHPPEDRVTPSPRTQVANQSFQAHLNSLEAETRMRKKKVMEWIQKSSNEAWDRENRRKEGKDPTRLKLDPVSHLPAQAYMKQEPIYADLDSASPVPPTEDSVLSRASGSLPNQSWVPEMRSGTADLRYRMEPRHRMEPRPRGATVTGSKMQPFPASSQRQYPQPSRQNPGVQGRGGREVQGSTGQPNLAAHPNLAASYPTAKFEKDYYILDV